VSGAETVKAESRALRGGIAEELEAPTDHFEEREKLLLKFHGVYQQDDRDARRERSGPQHRPGAKQGDGKRYSFMARVAIPGGVLTAAQYLELDRIAGELADGTLRLTTRQGVQFHGVLKGALKPALSRIDRALLTTFAACGDVRRNVMACPAPLADAPHRAVQALAAAISRELEPRSRAYHEIWVDGERQPSAVVSAADAIPSQEPFYGATYLPRKFKIGVALADDNCIDAWAYDCALVGRVERGEVVAYTLLAGGGLGLTHQKADTFARLASALGEVAPEQAVAAVRAVAEVFRDHGNREDRRHARLKYLLEAWGVDRVRDAVRARLADGVLRSLPASAGGRPVPAEPRAAHQHDHLDGGPQGDGRSFYGVRVESGRIADRGGVRLRSALREVVERFTPGVRATPMQSLLLTDLETARLEEVEAVLVEHGVEPVRALRPLRRLALACPALPTCGLALADAERALPGVLPDLERELARLGLEDAPLTVRMTGCPNGCARPYNADIGLVGRRPGFYHVLVGGGLYGDRLAEVYAADVALAEVATVLRPLLERFAAERAAGEGLSDFYQRARGAAALAPRRLLTGRETPAPLVSRATVGLAVGPVAAEREAVTAGEPR
jgi:sulfite reductase beta subunit-like hemoprotein